MLKCKQTTVNIKTKQPGISGLLLLKLLVLVITISLLVSLFVLWLKFSIDQDYIVFFVWFSLDFSVSF